MIEVKNLTKSLNQGKVVDDISFTAKKGETIIILGTSGSGKTTTLKMINHLISPDKGEVWINHRLNSSVPGHILRRGIGYVLQENGLFPHLTVGENIAIVPRLLGWSKERIKNQTFILLERLGLDIHLHYKAYPAGLSGGQRQRVGFARALISSPPILLMDEPFGALDPITRTTVRSDFKKLPELSDKCIVMVTHDIDEAFELGDRIMMMDQGKIQQLGSKQDLILRPANDFVKNFLKSHVLFLQMRIRSLSTFFKSFLPVLPEKGKIIGRISAQESFEKALALFSPGLDLEVLAIEDEQGNLRYVHFKLLIGLLAEDIPV